MTKWSIVKRISVYGCSFTSKKHMALLAPADLTRTCMFSSLINNNGEEDEQHFNEKIINHSEGDSNFISTLDHANLIKKYTREGNLTAAYDLLQSLQDKNIHLPKYLFNNLLFAAGEKNDTKLSCRVFKELLLLSGNHPLSTECYLNLARSFINTDDCTHLTSLLKEISELIVINRTILAFAETRQIGKVVTILKQMKEWQCKPDVITYNSVLDILGRTGQVNEMLKLFSSMDVSGDIITYNTMLNGMRKACRFDMCLVLYKEMVKCGIEPDLLSYTAVIDSLGRSGNVKESLRVFDEMKERKIQPSVYVYRALIDSLKKSGDFQTALELSDELKNSCSLDLASRQDFKPHLRSHRRQKGSLV